MTKTSGSRAARAGSNGADTPRVGRGGVVEAGGPLVVPFGEMTQAVHELTREAILDGSLEPGRQVSQLELARQLGVSRTPLREALRLLEREGLVVVRGPHRLVQVAPLSMADLDELYALRVVGEAIALRLTIPTLRQENFSDMWDDLEALETAPFGHEMKVLHRRFHAGLRIGVGDRMAGTLSMLFEHAERYQLAYVVRGGATHQQKNAEHRAILAACEAGEADEAVRLLIDHMASTALTLMAAERYAPRALADALARGH